MNKYQLRQLPLTIAVSSTLAAGSLQAATITVDNPGDGPVGTFPSACTLRSAITAANTDAAVDGCVAGDAGLDEMVFDPVLAGSTVVLASVISVTDSLSITGPVPDDSSGITIDINGADRHFQLIGTEPSPIDVSLNGLRLIDGSVSGNYASGGAIRAGQDVALSLEHVELSMNGAFTGGGAVAVYDGSLTLSNSVVRDNMASAGGGLLLYNSSLTVIDSTIISNETSGPGGGIWVQADLAGGADVLIEGSTVDNNFSDGQGGGLYAVSSLANPYGNILIRDSSFSGNTAYSGGGGLHLDGRNGTDVSLIRTQINDNGQPFSPLPGDGRSGGGLNARDLDSLSLIDSAVNNNLLDGRNLSYGSARGGGAHLYFIDDVEIRSTVISGNLVLSDSVSGGGLSIRAVQAQIVDSEISLNELTSLDPSGFSSGAGLATGINSSINVVNSTISENLISYLGAGQEGAAAGALFLSGGSIVHSTIARNRVVYGSVQATSLGVNQSVSLTNTVISGPANADECAGVGAIVDLGGNLATDASCTGVATDPADLALLPLDDNGGPTRTHALGAGSVAIDAAGDCRTTLGIETDQRGVARGRLCDVGAFEVFEAVIFSDRFEG